MSQFTLPPQAVDALRRGNKIEAIKLLRQASGLGLAEAKGIIDRLDTGAHASAKPVAAAMTAHPARPAHPLQSGQTTGLSPGEVPRGAGGAFGTVILVAAAAAGIWAYIKFF